MRHKPFLLYDLKISFNALRRANCGRSACCHGIEDRCFNALRRANCGFAQRDIVFLELDVSMPSGGLIAAVVRRASGGTSGVSMPSGGLIAATELMVTDDNSVFQCPQAG